MPKITRITVQKNGERFNIFIDNGHGEEFGFGVDQDVYIEWNLKKGMELKESDIEQIKAADDVKKAFNLSLLFLSYRMRSNKEIVDYLHKKEYATKTIQEVIQKLKKYDYINDKEFAKAFVSSKKSTSMKGPNILKQELFQKGISKELISETVGNFSFEEQVEKAMKLLQKKGNAGGRYSPRQLQDKLSQYLLAKGYSYDVIEAALRKHPFEINEDEEWEAVLYQGRKGEKKYKHLSEREFRLKMKQWLYQKGFSMNVIEKYLNTMIEDD